MFVLLDTSMCKSISINSNNNNSNNNQLAYRYLDKAYEMTAFWTKSNVIRQKLKKEFFLPLAQQT